MIWFLRLLFLSVIASMLAVTSWASMHGSLFAVPPEVVRHPWFLATLVDAYWGFVTFFVWLAWKEQNGTARVLWFVAVMLLGNIAMATYVLRELFAVDSTAGLSPVFTRRNPGTLILPGVLAAAAVGVYLVA